MADLYIRKVREEVGTPVVVAFVGGGGIERYKCIYLMFGYLEFSASTPF